MIARLDTRLNFRLFFVPYCRSVAPEEHLPPGLLTAAFIVLRI